MQNLLYCAEGFLEAAKFGESMKTLILGILFFSISDHALAKGSTITYEITNFDVIPTVTISSWQATGGYYWMFVRRNPFEVQQATRTMTKSNHDKGGIKWEPVGWDVILSTMDYTTPFRAKLGWNAYSKEHGVSEYKYIDAYKVPSR